MTPAVYRNARYERRLALAERRIIELANCLAMQAEAMGNLYQQFHRSTDVDALIPPLPEIRDRAFGMGH